MTCNKVVRQHSRDGEHLHGAHSSVPEEEPLVHLAALVPLGGIELPCLLRQVHHHRTTLEHREVRIVMINCMAVSSSLFVLSSGGIALDASDSQVH